MVIRKDGAFTVAAVYFIASMLWIAFSDFAVNSLPHTGIQFAQTAKGTLFVIMTSTLLFIFVKRYNSNLSLSERQYRGFYEDNPVPMWIYDRKTLSFVNVNKAAVAQYGFSKKEFLSMTIEDIRPSHEVTHLHDFIKNSRPENLQNAGIWQHQAKDNSVFFVSIVSQPLGRADANHVLVMASNTTERVIYENKLQKANEELETVNADLKLRKRFLREVNQMARIGGWQYYPDQQLFYFSDDLPEVLGFDINSHSEPFQCLLDHVHPDDRSIFEAEKAEFERNGLTINRTTRIIADNGELKYIHRIVRHEYSVAGDYCIRGTMQDVTLQKLVEQERDDALARYDLACEATQDMIYEFDFEQNNIAHRQNFGRITNPAYCGEADPTKAWFSIIHPDDLSRVVNTNQLAIRDGKSKYSCEYRINFDGTGYRHIIDQACILYDHGKASRLIGAITDVHQIKSISEENRRLGEVINEVDNMALIVDTEHHILWMNKAMERFTNQKLREVIGQSPVDLLVREYRDEKFCDEVFRRITAREKFSISLPIYNANDEQIWVQSEFKPLFDELKKYIGYVIIHTDITNMKAKERSLLLQNETLRDIAWMESHELRRPLASLMGLVNLIRDSKNADEQLELIELVDVCALEMDEKVRMISNKIHTTLCSTVVQPESLRGLAMHS